jgi:hypothetical protein
MALVHTDIVSAIRTILATTFTEGVFSGPPKGLPPGGPYGTFWYLGRTDPPTGRETWGNVMLVSRWQVACIWPRYPERTTHDVLEAVIADAEQALRTAFRGDSTLNGKTTDLKITDSEVDLVSPETNPNSLFRSVAFELQLIDLEGEAIAA